MSSEASDHELLQRWCDGERHAGAELLRRHSAALHRFLKARSVGDVRDLAQQTMLACVEGRDRFRGDSSFRSYMLQIARYQLHAHYRAVSRTVELDASELIADSTSPSGKLRRREGENMLLHALKRLPPTFQAVLQLAVFEDLSGPEVADILQIPEPTVRSRTRRAIAKLRVELQALAERVEPQPERAEVARWLSEARGSEAEPLAGLER